MTMTNMTCSKCTLHIQILQLLCKYFTLLCFKSCLPVAMTHHLDLWHLKMIKTAYCSRSMSW
jgi:hypothetical protein